MSITVFYKLLAIIVVGAPTAPLWLAVLQWAQQPAQ